MREDSVYIEDILQSILVIQEHLEGKSESDFENSLLLQDAVYRRFSPTSVFATVREDLPHLLIKLKQIFY